LSSDSHHTKALQRKVIRIAVAIAAILLLVGVPLTLMDDVRLDLARNLSLVPGRGAEQLADADDGATLVVVPIADASGAGPDRYAYKAQFIGLPVADGTELTDIDSGQKVTIPLTGLDFVAAANDGTHILFRGPSSTGNGSDQSVLVDATAMTAQILPEGQKTPEIAGDWETPVWAKTTGMCDRYSPEKKFVACFNRADAASYLAGDWQIDIQLYGNYKIVEPLYRGAGFLPIVGFANHDTWLYFQNENGIWRIQIPADMQDQAT